MIKLYISFDLNVEIVINPQLVTEFLSLLTRNVSCDVPCDATCDVSCDVTCDVLHIFLSILIRNVSCDMSCDEYTAGYIVCIML